MYSETDRLGGGSYGHVVVAYDLEMAEKVALKIIKKENLESKETISALLREIEIHSTQQHPHIIQMKDFYEDDLAIYIVLELASNGSLFQYQNVKGCFTEKEAFVYFFQTLIGIDYLHYHEILHRDLKLENLLLDKDYNIKICDFGWSMENSHLKKEKLCYTGTLQYMAPEMLRLKSYDHKVDIWALGVLLYEITHGKSPFHGEDNNELQRKVLAYNETNQAYSSSISKELVEMIHSMLRANPFERAELDVIFESGWIKFWCNIFSIDLKTKRLKYVGNVKEKARKKSILSNGVRKSIRNLNLNKKRLTISDLRTEGQIDGNSNQNTQHTIDDRLFMKTSNSISYIEHNKANTISMGPVGESDIQASTTTKKTIDLKKKINTISSTAVNQKMNFSLYKETYKDDLKCNLYKLQNQTQKETDAINQKVQYKIFPNTVTYKQPTSSKSRVSNNSGIVGCERNSIMVENRLLDNTVNLIPTNDYKNNVTKDNLYNSKQSKYENILQKYTANLSKYQMGISENKIATSRLSQAGHGLFDRKKTYSNIGEERSNTTVTTIDNRNSEVGMLNLEGIVVPEKKSWTDKPASALDSQPNGKSYYQKHNNSQQHILMDEQSQNIKRKLQQKSLQSKNTQSVALLAKLNQIKPTERKIPENETINNILSIKTEGCIKAPTNFIATPTNLSERESGISRTSIVKKLEAALPITIKNEKLDRDLKTINFDKDALVLKPSQSQASTNKRISHKRYPTEIEGEKFGNYVFNQTSESRVTNETSIVENKKLSTSSKKVEENSVLNNFKEEDITDEVVNNVDQFPSNINKDKQRNQCHMKTESCQDINIRNIQERYIQFNSKITQPNININIYNNTNNLQQNYVNLSNSQANMTTDSGLVPQPPPSHAKNKQEVSAQTERKFDSKNSDRMTKLSFNEKLDKPAETYGYILNGRSSLNNSTRPDTENINFFKQDSANYVYENMSSSGNNSVTVKKGAMAQSQFKMNRNFSKPRLEAPFPTANGSMNTSGNDDQVGGFVKFMRFLGCGGNKAQRNMKDIGLSKDDRKKYMVNRQSRY